MKVKIEFECDNAAFIDNPHEVGRIIAQAEGKLARLLAADADYGSMKLLDSNGNSVGQVVASRNPWTK